MMKTAAHAGITRLLDGAYARHGGAIQRLCRGEQRVQNNGGKRGQRLCIDRWSMGADERRFLESAARPESNVEKNSIILSRKSRGRMPWLIANGCRICTQGNCPLVISCACRPRPNGKRRRVVQPATCIPGAMTPRTRNAAILTRTSETLPRWGSIRRRAICLMAAWICLATFGSGRTAYSKLIHMSKMMKERRTTPAERVCCAAVGSAAPAGRGAAAS